MLDAPSESNLKNLVSNIAVIARALASHVYNITDEGSDEDAALYDDALVSRSVSGTLDQDLGSLVLFLVSPVLDLGLLVLDLGFPVVD